MIKKLPAETPHQKPAKLTLLELRGRDDIPPEDRERMEALVIRLIQVQDQAKALEAERGYTEGGKRVRGIQDDLEDLFIAYDLGGIRVEDWNVIATHGTSAARISKELLLAEGVTPDVILAATVGGSGWTSLSVRKDHVGG